MEKQALEMWLFHTFSVDIFSIHLKLSKKVESATGSAFFSEKLFCFCDKALIENYSK